MMPWEGGGEAIHSHIPVLHGSPAEHDSTECGLWSHAKMCVVELIFKLNCTVNFCTKFKA